MKDKILNRLDSIEDLKDRRALKEAVGTVFTGVVDYNLGMYERLEGRIYSELDDPLEQYYIYTTIAPRSAVDVVSPFMHPMIKEDLKELVIDMEALEETMRMRGELVLTQIFMECDYLIFRELTGDRTFKGFVHTDNNVHEIEVKLRQSKRYIDVIEQLYRVFQYNGVEWHTINCPYAYKFADVILSSQLQLESGESIRSVTLELSEFEPYKRPDMVPLWNIDSVSLQDKVFPMAAKDRIYYEHVIPLRNIGIQNGFLVSFENPRFQYTRRTKKELSIASGISGQQSWNLLRIKNKSNDYQRSYSYEVLSNKRDLGFAGRFASVKSLPVRTRGELTRIVNAYEVAKDIEFIDAQVVDVYSKEYQTQDYNYFIDDNIRRDTDKKILLISFKSENIEHYLTRDKMSFLTSQIQLLFPEYHCVGELI